MPGGSDSLRLPPNPGKQLPSRYLDGQIMFVLTQIGFGVSCTYLARKLISFETGNPFQNLGIVL